MIRLCAPHELPEAQGRGFSIAEKQLFAVRKDGEVFVYRNRCPHHHLPLEWRANEFLDDSASLIRCAHHGALFLIDSGDCVAGPCAGKSLTVIHSRETEDGVWVEL